MDERELVKGVLESKRAAQERFYSLYRQRLYRTCVHFIGFQDNEAEDIVQETFLVALKKMPEFDFRHKLISWLTKITVNLCYERIRERKRLILMLEEDISAIVNSKLKIEPDRADEKQEAGRLAMLKRLAEDLTRICRKIIDLRDWQGKSYVEIGRILKLPIGTVMSRLHRCRAMLRQRVIAAEASGP